MFLNRLDIVTFLVVGFAVLYCGAFVIERGLR